VAVLAEARESIEYDGSKVFLAPLWGISMSTRFNMSSRFNSKLPVRPESVEAVMKVLSENDELIVRDIARLGGLTQSQAMRALEELVTLGKVVVRKLQRPRKTFYRIGNQG
jgi:DNA-binding transcriptional ArsR family regulator